MKVGGYFIYYDDYLRGATTFDGYPCPFGALHNIVDG